MNFLTPEQTATQTLHSVLEEALQPSRLLEENEQEEGVIRSCFQYYKQYELEAIVHHTIADGAVSSLAYITHEMQKQGTYPHSKMHPFKYDFLTSYIGAFVLNTAATIASKFLNPSLRSLSMILGPEDHRQAISSFANFIGTCPPSFVLDAQAQGFAAVMSALNSIKDTSPSYYHRQLKYHLNQLSKY